jgi:cytochrome b561
MAPLMIGAFTIGEMMEDLPRGPDKQAMMGWHILVGLAVAALLIPRIFVRARGVPPLPDTMPAWQALLAKAAHVVLYGTMFALPVLGLVAILAGSRNVPVLGLFQLPSILPVGWLHGAAEDIHGAVAKVFLVTLVLHVIAALWHAIVRRDGLAGRMIPFLSHN